MIPSTNHKDLIDKLKINPFIDGPAEALCRATAHIISRVKEWRYIFSDNIDAYERCDYSVRQLPALRVYSYNYRKEQESHYITGDLTLDIVYPSDLRREEQQRFQDVLSAAMVQQFRRPTFFAECKEMVPGLNELGKTFDVDKSLAVKWDEGFSPLTQMRANFRIDLKMWDAYLESTGRTKDDPFNVTLGELVTIAGVIVPKRDDQTADTDAQIELDVKAGGE